jgi:cytochrome c biogenesis protein CcdA
MDSYFASAATAIWLGIMTSISPCPLATNIAALSYIGKRAGNGRQAVWSGIAYVVGRLITYVVIGIIVVAGLLSIPGVSNFLQKYMNTLLGPLLIVVGLVLLDWLPLSFSLGGGTGRMTERAASSGVWGAGLLGMIFALSFCPISAALFFGSLIPLSVQHESYVVLPSLYGIGTGLPVAVFGVLVAFGAQSVARAFNRLTQLEKWVRKITGVLFILIGVYLILRYIFQVI